MSGLDGQIAAVREHADRNLRLRPDGERQKNMIQSSGYGSIAAFSAAEGTLLHIVLFFEHRKIGICRQDLSIRPHKNLQ
jgi:hypothetical protein